VFIDDAESLFKWTRVIANYRPPFHRARPLSLALTLLPCGAVEREELRLAKALTTLGVLVTIAKEQPIPSAAFNSRRRQTAPMTFSRLRAISLRIGCCADQLRSVRGQSQFCLWFS
jgi:hypothetical protein